VVLVDWIFRLLAHIKLYYRQDYSPNVVLMDQGPAEFDTIAAAFPSARVFYCYFHVLKSVTALMMRAKDNRAEPKDSDGNPVERLKTANAEIQVQAVWDVSSIFFWGGGAFSSLNTATTFTPLSLRSAITLTLCFSY